MKKGFAVIRFLTIVCVVLSFGVAAFIAWLWLNPSQGTNVQGDASKSAADNNPNNAKRNADIEKIAEALRAYYKDHGAWPDNGSGAWACVSKTCYGEWVVNLPNPTVDAALAPYLPEKPVDPPSDTRINGGYLYNKYFGGDYSYYDGQLIDGGDAFLNWDVELPANPNSCGKGHIYSVSDTVVQCLLKVS